jgi:hypothetical protein
MTDQTQLLRDLIKAVDAEMSEGWGCNSYHPSLSTALEAARAALSAPAQPASGEAVPDGVWNALQRLIENGGSLGPASQEDALVVARHRDRVRFMTPPASQDQANNLCFELSTHLGCAPSNADVIDAVSSLIDARQTASQEQAQPSGEAVGEVSQFSDDPQGHLRGYLYGPLTIGTKLYTSPQPAQPAARVAMTRQQVMAMAVQEQFLLICDDLEALGQIVEAVEVHHKIGKAEQ